jgi:glycosyltransferase involved in cell wall biosynthesis
MTMAEHPKPAAAGLSLPARVTIFVPTYNRAHWVRGAIESALAQTFPSFHVVVSDNASTDATADVVAGYDDPRVTYVRLEQHLGLNEHFNLCLERASTDYVFLLPDDDRMEPGLLEQAVAVLDANERVGVVHGQVTVVDEEGARIAEGHGMTGLHGDAVETGEEFIERTMAMSYRVHASTALLRTEAAAAVRLDERDSPATDLGLWLRLALGWDIAYLARPLAEYRIHADAYSAGAADVTAGGYIQRAQRIENVRDVKLRFLREHGHRLADASDLRAEAVRAFRRELVEQAGNATLPDRRFATTVRVLEQCARLDRGILLEPAAWRLLVGSVLGRRIVSALKRLRDRPQAQGVAA